MIDKIIQFGGLAIAAASTTITILKTIKTKKKEKIVKLAKIVQQIPEFICEAEEALGSGTGKAKLSYVLDKLNIKCLQANIEFDEDGLKAEIENILETPQKKK